MGDIQFRSLTTLEALEKLHDEVHKLAADVEKNTADIASTSGSVAFGKLQAMETNRLLGRDTTGSGVVEELQPSEVRTMLNVEDGANNYTLPDTAVTAASYTNTDLTVDAQGRITAASSGSSGSFPVGSMGAFGYHYQKRRHSVPGDPWINDSPDIYDFDLISGITGGTSGSASHLSTSFTNAAGSTFTRYTFFVHFSSSGATYEFYHFQYFWICTS